MCKGVHKQLRILKVKALKQIKIRHKCVWGCSSILVKEGRVKHTNGSVKIPPHMFSCGAAALIPRIPKDHIISSPHSVPPPSSPPFTPSSFFPCSALQQQHKENGFISTLPWAPAAKLPVCLWGQLVIFCVSVRLCVFIESRKEHSLLFRCQLDLVVAAVGKARISLWVVNWTTCYGAAEGD